ncbi:hypothetical protein ONZ45_g8350 [Pleurotus djamor]|nr:hypothetical protein ONZ45_g8350 [Pleurotus djamor]
MMSIQLPSEEVFHTPELIRAVVAHLQPPDLYHCASVCHQWSEPSLDRLWYKITNIHHLLRLLAPLVEDGTGMKQIFSQPLDWTRFTHYNYRVRVLYDLIPDTHFFVYQLVSATSPLPVLLPNLQELQCSIHAMSSFLFSHVGVQKLHLFEIEIREASEQILSLTLQYLPLQMPQLTSLEISLPSKLPHPLGAPSFGSAIGSLPSIRTLAVAGDLLTADSMVVLSKLRNLERLEVTVVAESLNILSKIHPHSFESLLKLKFHGDFRQVIPWVSTAFAPNLVNLSIFSELEESDDCLLEVLERVEKVWFSKKWNSTLARRLGRTSLRLEN